MCWNSLTEGGTNGYCRDYLTTTTPAAGFGFYVGVPETGVLTFAAWKPYWGFP